MRALRLIGAIAQAEGLRLKAEARDVAQSAMVVAASGLFGRLAVGFLHAAALIWLSERLGPIGATLSLAAVDTLLALLILLRLRRRPSGVAAEALLLRQRAFAALCAISPLREMLGLLAWRSPVHMLGGRLAEQVWRRLTRTTQRPRPEPTRRAHSG